MRVLKRRLGITPNYIGFLRQSIVPMFLFTSDRKSQSSETVGSFLKVSEKVTNFPYLLVSQVVSSVVIKVREHPECKYSRIVYSDRPEKYWR